MAVNRIARGDLAQTLTLAAEFRPYQEIEVHAKVAGYLKSISVDVGDRVSAGQLLAVLEIPELQDDMATDEASVKRSSEEVNRAQADIARAESAHDVAHLGATRLSAVMKQRPNLVAQQDIDEAQGRDRIAEAQVATAKAAVAAAQEQLAVRRANQNKTKTLFAYARITAPFAGVITHRYADTGAMIQAGTASQSQAMPIVRLSQNNLLRLIIQVPESAVSRIHIGAPVNVKVAGTRPQLRGAVSRASPAGSTPTPGRWRPRWMCRTRRSSWSPGCTPTRRLRPTRRTTSRRAGAGHRSQRRRDHGAGGRPGRHSSRARPITSASRRRTASRSGAGCAPTSSWSSAAARS